MKKADRLGFCPVSLMSAADADGWMIAIRYTFPGCWACVRDGVVASSRPAMNSRRLIGHLCGSADPTPKPTFPRWTADPPTARDKVAHLTGPAKHRNGLSGAHFHSGRVA